jgi:hypothetical protein
VTNKSLAYCTTKFNTTVKSFIIQPPWFTMCSRARVNWTSAFHLNVRLVWKWLVVKNDLAYNRGITYHNIKLCNSGACCIHNTSFFSQLTNGPNMLMFVPCKPFQRSVMKAHSQVRQKMNSAPGSNVRKPFKSVIYECS